VYNPTVKATTGIIPSPIFVVLDTPGFGGAAVCVDATARLVVDVMGLEGVGVMVSESM
jgi:hypothetical protein